MSTTTVVENPIRERVSVSCARCSFAEYGLLPAVEPVARRHAQEYEHPVMLYLSLVFAGAWQSDGKFEQMKGGKLL